MTFNIPKDILAPPPPDPQSRGVFESGGRRSSDNPEANNVGDPPRKAFSDPSDLQSTSDVMDKGEDLQMCDQKRRRQPESVKSDFARRWTKTSRIILSSYLKGYSFNIPDHHSYQDFDISDHHWHDNKVYNKNFAWSQKEKSGSEEGANRFNHYRILT